MKRRLSLLLITLLLLLVAVTASAQEAKLPLKITRLSGRVMVFQEVSMTANVTVINSKKGLVVIDASGSPTTARQIRKLAEKEFGRKNFVYVVNTHHHWDHCYGDIAFPEAEVVAYKGCVASLKDDMAGMPRLVSHFENRAKELKAALVNMPPDSETYKNTELRYRAKEQEIADYSKDFSLREPKITFEDKLNIDLGDMTLKMYYFGRAHSGNDIFIHIPEEKLLFTGDVFLDQNWLPLFCGMRNLDIDRWIEVLATVLDGKDKVETVVTGHRRLWDRAKLDLWRDYIVYLKNGVSEAKAAHKSPDEFIKSHPLAEKYLYLKEDGFSQARLDQFHEQNIRFFWENVAAN
jgi:cyclase